MSGCGFPSRLKLCAVFGLDFPDEAVRRFLKINQVVPDSGLHYKTWHHVVPYNGLHYKAWPLKRVVGC